MAPETWEHGYNEIRYLKLIPTDHPLLEVRSRCLRGVSFKLKNGIVAASELVHERAFLTGLLEWFNFEEWALESHVLGLIAQLAEVRYLAGLPGSLIPRPLYFEGVAWEQARLPTYALHA